MELAGEAALVAMLLAAEHRAPVRAGIDDRVELARFVARDDDRLTADAGREIVVVLRYLALVGEIDPVPLEDVLHLEVEQGRSGEYVGRHEHKK
ncbi:hypothetical protein ECMM28_4430 [Escherichia coli]|nr:hypothetical protein ECMM28_4430 [Escherichia coli]